MAGGKVQVLENSTKESVLYLTLLFKLYYFIIIITILLKLY